MMNKCDMYGIQAILIISYRIPNSFTSNYDIHSNYHSKPMAVLSSIWLFLSYLFRVQTILYYSAVDRTRTSPRHIYNRLYISRGEARGPTAVIRSY
jgi:hypothetical protein